MTPVLAIIGGTGLNRLATDCEALGSTDTPFGAASSQPQRGRLGGRDVVFLARHGQPHRIAPHLINYRANLWLLRELGVRSVIASNAVGGISDAIAPGDIVIPHQLIDYTWGREHSYAGVNGHPLVHVDFTEPYDAALRDALHAGAQHLALDCAVFSRGVYAATQGPRLESAAEIDRLARDGCDVVGMTGMPEAGLARELQLAYASICLVVNRAAGRGEGAISEADIAAVAKQGMAHVETVIAATVQSLAG
jgi:5'-methylthioinosine phosphorylase